MKNYELYKEFYDAGWILDYEDLNCFSVTFCKPIPYYADEMQVISINDLTYEKELSDFDPEKPWNVGDWTVHSYTKYLDGEEDHYALTLTEIKMILRLIEKIEELKKNESIL